MPIVLLVMVGIFEIGRAYQTYQVLTNAAREGARAAVVPSGDVTTVQTVVQNYMTDGQVEPKDLTKIAVNRNATVEVNGQTVGVSLVTISYPYTFMVLQPVAELVVANSTAGSAFTMTTTSLMRNESQ
jgi:Flp pilus assembly protein TadG